MGNCNHNLVKFPDFKSSNRHHKPKRHQIKFTYKIISFGICSPTMHEYKNFDDVPSNQQDMFVQHHSGIEIVDRFQTTPD